jgi:hypothetical protein
VYFIRRKSESYEPVCTVQSSLRRIAVARALRRKIVSISFRGHEAEVDVVSVSPIQAEAAAHAAPGEVEQHGHSSGVLRDDKLFVKTIVNLALSVCIGPEPVRNVRRGPSPASRMAHR